MRCADYPFPARGGRCGSALLVLLLGLAGGCAARPLGIPEHGRAEAFSCDFRFAEALDGTVTFKTDRGGTLAWTQSKIEHTVDDLHREWRFEGTDTSRWGNARIERIPADCSVWVWRQRDLEGAYILEVPELTEGWHDAVQVDGGVVPIEVTHVGQIDLGGQVHEDCFEVAAEGELIGGRSASSPEYENRRDVYCRGEGLVYREADRRRLTQIARSF